MVRIPARDNTSYLVGPIPFRYWMLSDRKVTAMAQGIALWLAALHTIVQEI